MEEVARNVFVETNYDEVNVGAIVTHGGVICLDSPSYARDARDWAARMHRLSPYPVQYVVLTNGHGDRMLNTRWLNAPILAQRQTAEMLATFDKKYPQHWLDSLIIRNPQRGRELTNGNVEMPTMTFDGDLIFYRQAMTIELWSRANGSVGGCWVVLPQQQLLFCGDALPQGSHPHLYGPFCRSWIESLQELEQLSRRYLVIAGRGKGFSADYLSAALAYLQEMYQMVEQHYLTRRSNETISALASIFLPRFPLGHHPKEWVLQQIKQSLGIVYDEVKSDTVS